MYDYYNYSCGSCSQDEVQVHFGTDSLRDEVPRCPQSLQSPFGKDSLPDDVQDVRRVGIL